MSTTPRARSPRRYRFRRWYDLPLRDRVTKIKLPIGSEIAKVEVAFRPPELVPFANILVLIPARFLRLAVRTGLQETRYIFTVRDRDAALPPAEEGRVLAFLTDFTDPAGVVHDVFEVDPREPG